MAKVCHKALSAVLSVVLAAGLLPCLAWGEEPAASVSQQSIQFGQTIAAGENHSAAIKADGSLWMWGANGYGQLGDGTEGAKTTPVKIMDDVASVALGGFHSAAIKTDGSLWAWGRNDDGQVGAQANGATPVKIMDDVASVSLGGYHSAAIKTDGSLWMWGRGKDGQLGTGSIRSSAEPIKIMDDVASVSLGGHYSAAVKKDGSLWVWGRNFAGCIGDGTYERRFEPVKIMDNVASVSLGGSCMLERGHTAAIKTDGSLWMWGYNVFGQLGDGTNEDKATPVKVMDGVASASLGAETTAAIKKDGSLWTWGNYECGVVGNEQVESRNTPAMLAAGIADVCVGSNHTLAVGTDGALSTWGFNEKGELGDGSSGLNQDRYVPAIVMDGVALPNGLAPLPSPSDVIPSDSFTVDATFKVSGGSKYATTSVNWDDAWFNTSSYTYNHSLATTAAVLSASAYANGYVKEALRDKLGFDAFDAVEYHPSGNDYKGNYDQVGYSIETRMTANGVPIVAVVVRGTPGNGEWLSNLNVADTRKGSSKETHEGFERAAGEVLDAFTSYVKENNIDLGKARVLITGHSRGASVANILGAQLDEGKGNVNGALTPSRVYDFTFESPTTTLSNSRGNWVYDNIFNILNPEDVITRVPLCEWGYGRYGEDLVLPSRSNTNDVVYKQLLSSMNEYFKQFSGETFRGYTAGTLTATTMTSDMMSIAPTTWAFYHNYVVGTPPRYFFESVIKAAIMENADAGDYALLSSALLIPQYQSMLVTLFGVGVFNGAFVTGKGVVHGHTQETYVSWMKSASAALGELPSIFVRKNYRTVKVACPVDVKAYDVDGNLVASISGDQVDESLLENGLPAAVTADGVKMIDLPADGGYRLEVVATDEGEMDVTVEENDGSGSEPGVMKCYRGIALESGDSFTLDAQADGVATDCVLVDEATGEEAQAGSVVCGDDLEKVSISVVAGAGGDAWGGGDVVKGGKTVLHAMAHEGMKFIGWEREIGSTLDGDFVGEAVEGGEDLTVRATGNDRYFARFQREEPASVERLAGDSAAETSAAVALEAFPEGSEWVVVARDDDFADAMSATGLAGALNAPIVLTDRFGLSDAAADAVQKLGAKRAYVIGGKGAIPADLEGQLAGAGCQVQGRVYGECSWDTSVECAKKIAEHGGNPNGDAVVAMSANFQDALSISSFAYKYQVPILLETDEANGRRLTDEAASLAAGLPGTIYVPGGAGAVPESSVEGVFGKDRVVRLAGWDGYDTSNQIATYMVDHGLLSADAVCLASGAPDPKGVDALAGAALAGKNGGVVLLTNARPDFGDPESYVTVEGCDSTGAPAFLSANAGSVSRAYVLGGAAVMPPSLVDKIANVLS